MSSTVFYESASELATLTNTFKVGVTPTDPTTVTLTITTPSQVSTPYTYAASQITKSSTGVYTKDIACTEAGEWTFEWVGTGAASDDEAGTWSVHPTSMGKLYATPAALKSRFGITDTNDDYEIHQACFAAARSVEQICERVFYRSQSEARTFVPCDKYVLDLPEFNDLVSVTAVATDTTGDGTFETSWASSDYQLLPHNTSGPEAKPYTKVKAVGSYSFPIPTTTLARDDRVQITGVWGWSKVPYSVREASLILAADYFKLKDAPFGVAGLGEFGTIRVRENPRVMSLLGPYKRNLFLVR
jgi:hypothetical protein